MYITNSDNQIIDTDTGEIIDLELIKEAKQRQLVQNLEDINKDMIDIGVNLELKIISYKNEKHQCVSIKHGYTFGKVFRVTLRDVMLKGILSRNARLFIGTFEPFIYFPTNSIIINEGTPSIQELEKIIDLKKSTIQATLKELEQEEIIKRVKKNGQSIIYFNPFLYCAGAYVLKTTYELFKSSKYNTQSNK